MAKMRMHTDRLKKGMIISNDVYNNSGLLLVEANTSVSKEVLQLLANHFIEYVFAEYPQNSTLGKIYSSSGENQTQKATEEQKLAFKENMNVAEEALSVNLKTLTETNKEINVTDMVDTVNDILQKATADLSLYDMLSCMKSSKGGLYKHSINVAMVGQILARWMGFTGEEVELVVAAGLLHDIGIMELKKTDEEYDYLFFKDLWENKRGRYEKHVLNGYNILKDKKIDDRIKKAVLTHHERIDRSGFPLQVGLENISNISRAIAIADAYDIFTMQEKSDETISPLNVLKYLQDLSYSKLDPDMLMTFIEKITASYIQQDVILSNGRQGTIVMNNKYNLLRPLVSVNSVVINLATHPELHIVKFVD